MEHPEWYPAWRDEAFDQLQAKNSALNSQLRLREWDRYDYDLDTGTVRFSQNGAAAVVADVQIAGTTSVAAGDWLWAWANPDWPRGLTHTSELVREFGDKHGVCDLLHGCVEPGERDLGSLGWQLTAAAARICNVAGYRPPRDEGGGLYLLMSNVSWAV
jgi:hypothetical protein